MSLMYVVILAISLVASGCGHKMMRGTVAMKLNKKNAHVCLGDGSVKTGDKVAFITNKCTGAGGRHGDKRSCELVTLGEGTVSKVLNSHYSEIATDGSFSFDEGTIVEKMSK